MQYRKHLSEPWFSLIRDSVKTCEGRLNKGDFASMKAGDIIVFFNEEREFRTTITATTHYETFEQYLESETLVRCLPGVTTVEAGVAIYREFYSTCDEQQHGIVAISLSVY